MPKKEMMKLRPEQLGLSQKEIMYLFVFHHLSISAHHPAGLFQLMKERVPRDFLKSRTNFYAAINEMAKHDWIRHSLEGRKKVFFLTRDGEKKWNWYKETYYLPLSSVKEIANALIDNITGSGKKAAPASAQPYARLFNRLINVRELVIYLFLEALYRQKELTAKNILDFMKDEYGWSCSEGYLYELAHELEGEEVASKGLRQNRRIPWVEGKWDGRRRTHYKYRLTEEGLKMKHHAGETALFYIKNVHRYLNVIVDLLQDADHLKKALE